MKLEQLAEYSLFGNISSMKAVRIGNNSRDSLILGFRDAKVINCFNPPLLENFSIICLVRAFKLVYVYEIFAAVYNIVCNAVQCYEV